MNRRAGTRLIATVEAGATIAPMNSAAVALLFDAPICVVAHPERPPYLLYADGRKEPVVFSS